MIIVANVFDTKHPRKINQASNKLLIMWLQAIIGFRYSNSYYSFSYHVMDEFMKWGTYNLTWPVILKYMLFVAFSSPGQHVIFKLQHMHILLVSLLLFSQQINHKCICICYHYNATYMNLTNAMGKMQLLLLLMYHQSKRIHRFWNLGHIAMNNDWQTKGTPQQTPKTIL